MRTSRLIAVVILASSLLSLVWVFVVPIFQPPDEDVHFDYTISIYTANRLLLAKEKSIVPWRRAMFPISHPYTWHLIVRTGTFDIKGTREVKVPPSYGTHAYYRSIDATLPPSAEQYNNPWLIAGYPFLYYALAAFWMKAIALFDPSLTTLFFGARILSVLLTAIGLAAAAGIVRRLGASPAQTVVYTAALGFFPLTSFVSAAIQPDNLAFALANVSLWLAFALRDAGSVRARRRLAIALGLAMALLAVTKYHTFLCVFVAAGACLLTRRKDLLRLAIAVLTPLLIAGSLQMVINGGMQTQMQAHHPAIGFRLALKNAIVDYIGGGFCFRGFWWLSGWNKLQVTFPADALVKKSLMFGTWIVLALTAIRMMRGWFRSFRARRLAPLFSNMFLNSLLLFAAIMLVLHVITSNYFLAQGRHWYPFLPALLWLGCFYAPNLFRGKVARSLTWAMLLLLTSYSMIAAYAALHDVVTRFY
jgi:hypothetical protein